MTNFIKETIDALFSTNHVENPQVIKERAARERKKNAFIEEFNKLKKRVIKPALREIAEHMRDKDLLCDIEENSDTQERIARELNSIAIYFPTQGDTEKKIYEYPYVTFRANSHTETVNIYESTSSPQHRGHTSPVGDYKINQIDKKLVQATVMNVLNSII